jgi:hypothetical protein
MPTNDSNKKTIKLDDIGESGYSTRLDAHAAAMQAARAAIRAAGGCPTTCPSVDGKKRSPIRIADENAIETAVKIFRYDGADRDHYFGWFLDGDVITYCQCAESAK